MATWHFWLGTIGIVLYIVPIYVAGLTQGLMWRAFDDAGNLAYPDFVETVRAIMPMWWVRVAGGACYIAGALLLAVNFFKTWRTRPPQYDVPVHVAPRLDPEYADPPPPPPRIHNVAEIGRKIDVWQQAAWHRVWERLPLRFTTWVIVAVAVASLFEIVPTFLIRSNVPTIATVKPYTPLELAGRDIYVAEGCYNCHSQMIRPIFSETERYGEYSKPGEFVYDRPFQWGSRRIGPDLAREGGKQSNMWHLLHLRDPEATTPGSIMPAYDHLEQQQLNFKAIGERVQAAAYLGAEYDRELEDSDAMARAQARDIVATIVEQGGPDTVYVETERRTIPLADTKAIAVIAYLQRLGVDLFATEDAAAQATAESDVVAGAP